MLKAGGASQGVQACRGVATPIVGSTEEPVDAPSLHCIRASCVREVRCDGRAGMWECV